MPDHVIHRLSDALNDAGKPLRGSKVLLVGLAYKANVDDDRESPGYVLLDKMKSKGCEVAYYDPYIPVIRPSREHGHWAGTKCALWDQETVAGFDAVLIATAHSNVDYEQLGRWAQLIIDTRNAMKGQKSEACIVKA
jgi:UDP-N-acetyl-D-glucosamine dehydrogenase